MKRGIQRGRSHPLGATVCSNGVNFSIYSRSATALELLLFDDVESPRPDRVIPLCPTENRTFHYWHVFVTDVSPGQLYAYRAHGPNEPGRGLRFDGEKVLLDPYGRGVAVNARYDRTAAAQAGDNAGTAMKSVIVDPGAYDWEGDTPLGRPFMRTVIYELHVRGFTRHPSAGVDPARRGTYAGLIEKIPYLQDLGITAVELLPIFHFDVQDAPEGLPNYWGYSPVSFFAPHGHYSSRKDPLGPVDEFRDMVKALHRAGIEVILDVVYNHTAEGNERGPTLSFKGLENNTYYLLEDGGHRYANYSGTGNTLNANHSVVRRMILDSLRYWVQEMHVDGFRFDLASILARGESGAPLSIPPTLWSIESDPVLAGTKLIAEAWDAAGLYQVGSFIGDRWKEWNGRFRDDVRSFIKGDPGAVRTLPERLLASPDLYEQDQREPEQSVNFITCHDGFTLNDLVSYNGKHNEANGEENRDGDNNNLSWNCGAEGPSDDPEVERLRNRQVKNFHVINLLALGAPMLLMGDEVRRTQRGNNNAYCQDNDLSWFDWTLLDRHGDILRFVRRLIRFVLSLEVTKRDPAMTLSELLRQAQITWHGVKLGLPDWSDESRALAFSAIGLKNVLCLHIMFNAHREALEFELPRSQDGQWGPWQRVVDTCREPPEDFCDWPAGPPVEGPAYNVGSRSVVILSARARAGNR